MNSPPPNSQNHKGSDSLISIAGFIVGLVSLLFFPESNKGLCVLFALCAPLVFLPIGPSTMPNENKWNEFWSFFQIVRYVCVAWAALLIAQQVLKGELLKSGTEIFSEATIMISKAVQQGQRNDVRFTSLNRSPPFTSGPLFVVHAQSPTKAIALEPKPVITTLVIEQSKALESLLIWAGCIIVCASIVLRLLHSLVRVLTP